MFVYKTLAGLVCLLSCFAGAAGYARAVFDGGDLCKTLNPRFQAVDPEKVPTPFNITVDHHEYTPGQDTPVTLTITSTNKKVSLEGFLIMAIDVDPKMNEEDPVGKFIGPIGSQAICTNTVTGDSAITHGINYVKSLEQKFLWVPPKTGHRNIQFRVTTITENSTYWVDERSAVLIDPEADPLPTTIAPHAPTMTPIDTSGCGTSKGCYRSPAGCLEIGCDILVTWKTNEEAGYVDFEMGADIDGWVAMGLSYDKKMGDDDVMECVWNDNEVRVEVRHSYNQKDGRSNVLTDPRRNALRGTEGMKADGRIRCRFTRAIREPDYDTLFDLDKSYHLFMTRGRAEPNGKKLIHEYEPMKYPYVSPSKVWLNKNHNISGRAKYVLIKLHACLMLFGWMMCASVAILLVKYYKPMWPNDKLCGEKVWFSVHRGCLVTTLLCTIVGFILIFIHVGGYSQLPELPMKAHPPLGIVTTILVILNPLIAMCRPSPKAYSRPCFNWVHFVIGIVAMVLATPTLFIGLNLPKADVPWWATWVMVAFMLFHIVIELLLEIHGCINARKQRLREEEFELRKKADHRGDLYGRKPDPVGTRFKKRILSIYLFVVIVLGLVMIITVAVC